MALQAQGPRSRDRRRPCPNPVPLQWDSPAKWEEVSHGLWDSPTRLRGVAPKSSIPPGPPLMAFRWGFQPCPELCHCSTGTHPVLTGHLHRHCWPWANDPKGLRAKSRHMGWLLLGSRGWGHLPRTPSPQPAGCSAPLLEKCKALSHPRQDCIEGRVQCTSDWSVCPSQAP